MSGCQDMTVKSTVLLQFWGLRKSCGLESSLLHSNPSKQELLGVPTYFISTLPDVFIGPAPTPSEGWMCMSLVLFSVLAFPSYER